MRFLKIDAIEGWNAWLAGESPQERWINLYAIDDIQLQHRRILNSRGEPQAAPAGQPADKDGKLVERRTELALHAAATGAAWSRDPFPAHHTSFFVEGTPTSWAARIETAVLEDRRAALPAPDPAPAAPARLGYVYAANNLQFVSVAVADIDDYDVIEFRGRAAQTAGEALAVAESVSIKYPVSAVPINARPASAPRLVVPIPGADNINVGRSADGQTLYFLGQDGAAAFGIEVLGHKENLT